MFFNGLLAAAATAAEVDFFVDGLSAAEATAAVAEVVAATVTAATAAEVDLFVDGLSAATAAEVDLFVVFLEGGNRFLLRRVGLVIASVASSVVEAGEFAATLFLMRVDTRLGLAVASPFPPLDVGDIMMFMLAVRVMGNKKLFDVHTDADEQTNMQVGSQIDLEGY